MTDATAADLLAADEATWPAAAVIRTGPWSIRKGMGGGRRVSSARLEGALRPDDIARAADAMTALGQAPIFLVPDDDSELDAALAAAGYAATAATDFMAVDCAPIAVPTPRLTAFSVFPPLQVQRDIWAAGGVGAARLAIMDRAVEPKTTLLGRTDDRPAGTVFVAVHRGIGMVHALEVLPAHRRRGTARHLLRAAARWCRDRECRTMGLAVLCENAAARAVYAALGFRRVGGYHYRSKDGTHDA
ncbi:GCN5-related N-acetyltransferase [Oceaniovalibus guishaninsula JLT2003]|uniref:GCN5-related N-acetyltransferase n=1 Tax=Oceaniovalibus guishaninsula JLT2003 TaxID=1231392 RepID=K2HC80_9RHOB|nr:GNAT family N-acetyltransferase [Oceaniovalibus guishaninsula]EKE44217.1 GCN5-related N-acetyltransferase [Oceaniovalibus guishaninsula JLT2003]